MSEISDKTMELIAKLQNMTVDRGASENEAAIALQKMQKLLFDHNLSLSDVNVKSKSTNPVQDITDSYTDASVRTNRNPGAGFKTRGENLPAYEREWRVKLASSVARYNFCRIMIGGDFESVYFVGKPDNIEFVKIVWAYAIEQVDRLSYEALSARRKLPKEERYESGKEWRKNWLHGCVQRLNERLYDSWQALQTESNVGTALILVSDTSLQEYVDRKSSGNSRGYRTVASGSGAAAGYAAGNKVDLNRPAARIAKGA